MATAVYVGRSHWDGEAPRGSLASVGRTKGVKFHYTGGYVSPKVVTDHDECKKLVKQFQKQHFGQGWTTLGYNAVACGHKDSKGRYYLMAGRGVGKLPAANGAGLNTGHQAILVLVGSSGHTQPTADQVAAARAGAAYVRAQGHGSEIKGHRDGYSTSCPGEPLYKLLRAGKLTPGASGGGSGDSTGGGSKPRPTKPGVKPPYTFPLPGGHWFGPESSDPRNHSGFWVADRAHVEQIQRRLRARGWAISVDGRYGPNTKSTVRAFQAEKGLGADGLVGAQTWPVLWTATIT